MMADDAMFTPLTSGGRLAATTGPGGKTIAYEWIPLPVPDDIPLPDGKVWPEVGTPFPLHPLGKPTACRWFHNEAGRVLRFAARRARSSPAGEIEHYPAMLCVLSDARTGEQCGGVNIYLRPDGCDRIRDRKGKTCTGRARGAVVLLSDFDEPTMGLTICEGVEPGIAIYQSEQRPIWACGGAGMLANFPVLAGIDCLRSRPTPTSQGGAPLKRLLNGGDRLVARS
jgi:hypothetical protein